MNFFSKLAILAALPFALLCADDQDSQQNVWKTLYEADEEEGFRLIADAKCRNIDEHIMQHFMMAYLCYRIDQPQHVIPIFEGIDYLIEWNTRITR